MGERFRKAKITIEMVNRLDPDETVMDTDEPGFGVRRQGKGPATYFVRKFAMAPATTSRSGNTEPPASR
jgi:hypothetical protein